MPVEDHPVHEKVKRAEGHHPACFNRAEFQPYYVAMDRVYFPNGKYAHVCVEIPHNMSKLCRQISELVECEGCTSPRDEEYIAKMRALK